jgi:hypothetical protein
MTLHITDTAITSDRVPEHASRPEGTHWYVTTHPGREFDRNQAISAMTIAEEEARPAPDHYLIESLRSELQ